MIKGKHMGKKGNIQNLENGEVIISSSNGEIKIREGELIVLE